MRDGFKVFDTDTHIRQSAESIAPYLGPIVRERIPDLEDHEKVFRLLPVSGTIGVSLTEAYQLVPEQSTAAIVVHHPQAIYFAVREQVASYGIL